MLAPWLGVSSSSLRQITLIAIFTMVVCGINLSFGFAGELALGHVAMFAAGAYTAGMLAKAGFSIWVTLPAAAGAASAVGLVSGVPGLRLGGWGLAMASFFLVILVPDVVKLFDSQTGGLIGLQGIPRAQMFGRELSSNQFYVTVVASMVFVTALLRNLVTSRHGSALLVMRQSRVLAQSLGIHVFRLKVTAYVLGAIPAGIAGALFAYLDRFIAPDYFGFDLAIALIAASVLGGSASVYGAFFGAALLQLGPLRTTVFDQYALVAYGAFLVLGGVFFSGGAAGLAGRISHGLVGGRRTRTIPPHPAAGDVTLPRFDGATLAVTGLTQDFDGLRALDGVTLTAEVGKITGLIGPNGCGKTTLLNVVSGFYKPTSGSILVGDADVTGEAPHAVARAGVARTFQTPHIPSSMTTLETVAAARYSTAPVGVLAAMLRLPRDRRKHRRDDAAARNALRLLDIEQFADEPAAALPLGRRRLVEVARSIASDPKVLLLDEPAAGLDETDLGQLEEGIRRVRDAGCTVLLVEHNFRMVCDIADHVYVLDSGRSLVEGPPEVVQRDEEVSRVYLGQVSAENKSVAASCSPADEALP